MLYGPRIAAVLCGLVLTFRAQPAGEDLLAHVRAKVRDNVSRLSNYACTETVERKVYALRRGEISPKACEALAEADRGGRLISADRLRLDVGASKPGLEMYSWAGEKRFDYKSQSQLVQGLTSRGSFAGFLDMIFTKDPVAISYRGESVEGGRELAEYEFTTSRELSHLWHVEGFAIITAYDGTLVVDPKTFDVVRITIRQLGLPRTAAACASVITLNYQSVRLKDAALLLPAVVRLVAVLRNGTKSVDQTVFSDCREFVGQSAVHFREEPSKATSPEPAPEELTVTGNQQFEIVFTQDIDTRTAAAGDAIQCELATPIRNGERIVAPKGTQVTARIVELTRTYRGRRTVRLAFRPESIGLGGAALTLVALPSAATEEMKRPRGVTWSGAGDKLTGVIGLKGELLLTRGLRSEWLTGK